MNRKESWRNAIGRVLREDPFLGTIVLRHKVEWTNKVVSATIDGEVVRINEDWWKGATPTVAVFRLRHLASHVAFGHHLRRGAREQERWNMACDYAINPLLQLGDTTTLMDLPEDVGLPSGKAAEWYYDALKKEEDENNPDNQSGSGDGEDGDGSGAGGGDEGSEKSDNTQPSEGDEGDESEGGDDDDGADGDNSEKADDGDSEVSGNDGENEPDRADCGSPADNTQPNGESQLALTIVTANNAMVGAGMMKGWQEELVNKLLNPPPLNPKTLLRLYMTQAAQTKQTYSRTNRRSAWRNDIIMPGRFERTLGKVAVCVDTSGSVSLKELAWAMNAINEIIGAFPDTEVTVIEADTVVHRIRQYKGLPLPEGTTFKGRGGTLFEEALACAEKQDPTVILYVTDGQPGRWPLRESVRIPVVWFMTRTGAKAPWGRQIDIPVG